MRSTLLVPGRSWRGAIGASALIGAVLGARAGAGGSRLLGFALLFVAPLFLIGSALALRCRGPLAALACGFALFLATTLTEMTVRWTRIPDSWQSFITLQDALWNLGVIALE